MKINKKSKETSQKTLLESCAKWAQRVVVWSSSGALGSFQPKGPRRGSISADQGTGGRGWMAFTQPQEDLIWIESEANPTTFHDIIEQLCTVAVHFWRLWISKNDINLFHRQVQMRRERQEEMDIDLRDLQAKVLRVLTVLGFSSTWEDKSVWCNYQVATHFFTVHFSCDLQNLGWRWFTSLEKDMCPQTCFGFGFKRSPR